MDRFSEEHRETRFLGIDEDKSDDNDVEVYTYVRLENGRWIWHQEVFDKIIKGSRSSAPKNANAWLPLRFNTVDGEDYGRGRVEEFLGDLKSLEGLMQSMVEGSAAHNLFLKLPGDTDQRPWPQMCRAFLS